MNAIAPFFSVANFSVADVMAAAKRAVPEVEPEEVAQAFESLAQLADLEAAAINAELKRRGLE